ncbi:hypothetical protein DWU98_04635 [Dyella monticola]|uniref:Uncharacterized protein n=1 Tax=Dyella monticola TaxID=1927958 RepID=A0A370X5L1_9GAMM|nr:hypothetical protein DWU98_04635 [Dyella monticola]
MSEGVSKIVEPCHHRRNASAQKLEGIVPKRAPRPVEVAEAIQSVLPVELEATTLIQRTR